MSLCFFSEEEAKKKIYNASCKHKTVQRTLSSNTMFKVTFVNIKQLMELVSRTLSWNIPSFCPKPRSQLNLEYLLSFPLNITSKGAPSKVHKEASKLGGKGKKGCWR